jgi:hypothetical protein
VHLTFFVNTTTVSWIGLLSLRLPKPQTLSHCVVDRYALACVCLPATRLLRTVCVAQYYYKSIEKLCIFIDHARAPCAWRPY